MMNTSRMLLAAALLVWGSLNAANRTMAQGNSSEIWAAPPLDVTTWFRGKPVKLSDGKNKNIYIVEFWATWCPPCIETIPHLNELQRKYKSKGLEVVGITDEDAETVSEFLRNNTIDMDYHVGLDPDLKTIGPYMDHVKVETIPHAFIVDWKGNVVWHGYPLDDEMEKVIQRLIQEHSPQSRPPAKSKGTSGNTDTTP